MASFVDDDDNESEGNNRREVEDAIQKDEDDVISFDQESSQSSSTEDGQIFEADPGAQGIPGNAWVLTAEGARQVRDLVGVPFNAVVNGRPYECKEGFQSQGNAILHSIRTNNGFSVRASPQTEVMVRKGEFSLEGQPLQTLNIRREEGDNLFEKGSRLQLSDNSKVWVEDLASKDFGYGWLMGQLMGNGFVRESDELTTIRFPTKSKAQMKQQKDQARQAFQFVEDLLPTDFRFLYFSDFIHYSRHRTRTYNFNSERLTELSQKFWDMQGDGRLLDDIEKQSLAFNIGILQGASASKGQLSIGQGKKIDGIKFEAIGGYKLACLQRIFARVGIMSWLGLAEGTDGKPSWQLRVAGSSLPRFKKIIGFGVIYRQKYLEYELKLHRRFDNYWDLFTTEVTGNNKRAVAPVYKCQIERVGICDVNGFLIKMS